MVYRVNPNPLEATTVFPYLVRTFTYNNSYWAALYSNLRKTQKKWGMVAKVLGKTGALIKARENIYKALVQAVILYGSKTGVVMEAMMTVLNIIPHRIARLIEVMKARNGNDREWEWAFLDPVL